MNFFLKLRCFTKLKNPTQISFFYFFYLLCFSFFILIKPINEIVMYIPDDAFYYIKVVENKYKFNIWTFDGKNVTTGFHLGFPYLLLVLKNICNYSFKELLIIYSFFSSILLSISLFLTQKIFQKYFDSSPLLFLVIPFLCFSVVSQSIFLMESPLVIFFSSLIFYCSLMFTEKKGVGKFRIILLVFFAGLFGAISRSDFGLLPATLLFFSLLFSQEKSRKLLTISLAGATLGTLFVLIHTYIISGEITQGSAQIKLLWSSVKGHNILTPLHLLAKGTSISNFFIYPTLLFIFFIFFVKKTFPFCNNEATLRENPSLLIAYMSFAVILTYCLFYMFNSAALSSWYISNFIVPLSLLGAVTFTFFIKLNSQFNLYFLCLALLTSLTNFYTIPFPWQKEMYLASQIIKFEKEKNIYGSWNAGLISYFSGKEIINLDGLANNSVIPYIKNKTFLYYLEKENINSILDYEYMFEENRAKRGGYNAEEIKNCFFQATEIENQKNYWEGTKLFIYNKNAICKNANMKS